MMKIRKFIFLFFWILMLGFSAEAATYTVTNTSNDGAGSLHQAITDAVANPGADTVEFNIPQADANYITAGGAGYWRIRPTSSLPIIEDPNGTAFGLTIDGTTQTTNKGDTNPYGPEIMIDGTDAIASDGTGVSGLTVMVKDCVIKGLIINNYSSHGVFINGGAGNVNNTLISGCYIGTDASGEVAAANTANGIYIFDSASNVIGSSESGGRNIISGNAVSGISISGSPSSQNRILGNYIGTNRSGASALANWQGILISGGSQNNFVGSGLSGGRNIISGNTADGIFVSGSDSGSNTVKGNYIGPDVNGSASLGNGGNGISISDASTLNLVGGISSGDRNIISGNLGSGLSISGSGGNIVLGNYIGLDAAGTAGLGNTSNGISLLSGASSNSIGDSTAAGKNIISANEDNGIECIGTGTDSNEVFLNYFGTNANGDFVSGLQNTNNQIIIDKDAKYFYISSCRIMTIAGTGISLSNGMNGSKIEKNIIVGTSMANIPGISLAGAGSAVSPTVVSSNEIRNLSVGIAVETVPSLTITLNHCTIINTSNGIKIGGANVNVKNCIISFDPTGQNITLGTVGVSNETGTVAVGYSDIYGNALPYYNLNGTITKTATIHANPLFSGSASNDYTLKFNSPCVNTGTPEGSDMGAYQYSGVSPDVRVVSPNGSENWQEESQQYVTWSASNDVTSIDLYYSLDQGASYTAIAAGLSNTGSYLWTLPRANSTQSRVKVVANGPSSSSTDESDADFTISSKKAEIQGQIVPYPVEFKPLQGGACKIAYTLSTNADVKVYLINKYGKIHWVYNATAGTAGGTAGYNELTFDGKSDFSGSTVPNGIYMIKIVSQNRVIGTGHLVIID